MNRNSHKRATRTIVVPPDTKDLEKQIPNVHPKNDNFRFISTYDWLLVTNHFFRKNGFTNYLKNAKEFSKKMVYVVGTLIPEINQNCDDIFTKANNRSRYSHCHQLTGDQLKLAENIGRDLHGDDFASQTDDSFKWWQLGLSNGVRIVGIYSQSDDCFYPIFCDWHHLLFPSRDYNETDFKQLKFDPSD